MLFFDLFTNRTYLLMCIAVHGHISRETGDKLLQNLQWWMLLQIVHQIVSGIKMSSTKLLALQCVAMARTNNSTQNSQKYATSSEKKFNFLPRSLSWCIGGGTPKFLGGPNHCNFKVENGGRSPFSFSGRLPLPFPSPSLPLLPLRSRPLKSS